MRTMHSVAIAAFDGVVPFDLSTPCEVFGRARFPNGKPAYDVKVCGVARDVDAGLFALRTRHGLRELARADTIVLPGIADLSLRAPEELVRTVCRAANRGARVASICTGAFLLAATGLLDGRRATTHWLAAPELARRHPSIAVDEAALYIDEGRVLTSAGAAAGLDLCLHIVRRDLGAAAAGEVARSAVMPLERAGGQAQFIRHAPPDADGRSLEKLLRWIERHLEAELSLADLARRAGMSARTLARHFKDQTGTTPAQYVNERRIRRAQSLLETTAHSVDRIATDVGFGSPVTLRQRFREIVGTSPQVYRRTFRARPAR